MKILTLILLFFSFNFLCFADNDFIFDDHTRSYSRNLFLHSKAHYNFSRDENYRFEEEYMNGNAYRTTVGSISGKEFLLNQELVLNHQLNDKFWFRTYIFDEDGFHVNEQNVERYLELQYNLGNNWYASTLWTFAYRKDTVDTGFSLMKSDSNRGDFIKIDLIWEDFIYDDKNIEYGSQKKDSFGLNLMSKFETSNLYIYSKGKFSTGYEREYDSDDLIGESKTKNYFNFRADLKRNDIFGYKFEFSEFYKQQRYIDTTYDYTFYSVYYLNNINWEKKLDDKNRIFSELNYIIKIDDADEYKNYDTKRTDWIPVLGWLNKKDKDEFELSYKFAFIDIDSSNSSELNDTKDLLEGAWRRDFRESGFIRFSVSLFVEVQDFAGGNMRMAYYF